MNPTAYLPLTVESEGLKNKERGRHSQEKHRVRYKRSELLRIKEVGKESVKSQLARTNEGKSRDRKAFEPNCI